MRWFANKIDTQWRVSLGLLSLGIIMTLIYGSGWRVGLPVELRNLSGLVLFFCIMLGAGVSYIGARFNGAAPLRATKIAMLIPVVWHLKEIWAASQIFGFAEGIYAGLQGFYLFYYCLMLMIMGLSHLGCELYYKVSIPNNQRMWRCTGNFFWPILVLVGIEGIGEGLFGFEIFFFQGFNTGYRALFM